MVEGDGGGPANSRDHMRRRERKEHVGAPTSRNMAEGSHRLGREINQGLARSCEAVRTFPAHVIARCQVVPRWRAECSRRRMPDCGV